MLGNCTDFVDTSLINTTEDVEPKLAWQFHISKREKTLNVVPQVALNEYKKAFPTLPNYISSVIEEPEDFKKCFEAMWLGTIKYPIIPTVHGARIQGDATT